MDARRLAAIACRIAGTDSPEHVDAYEFGESAGLAMEEGATAADAASRLKDALLGDEIGDEQRFDIGYWESRWSKHRDELSGSRPGSVSSLDKEDIEHYIRPWEKDLDVLKNEMSKIEVSF